MANGDLARLHLDKAQLGRRGARKSRVSLIMPPRIACGARGGRGRPVLAARQRGGPGRSRGAVGLYRNPRAFRRSGATKNADIGDIVTPLGAAANARASVVIPFTARMYYNISPTLL